ncbi:MAG: glucoamylase family protein, partial [Trueperaceae bacterium]
MASHLPRVRERRVAAPPWNDLAPVRQELFGAERLEQHAASLAAAQRVAERPRAVRSLRARLDDDAAALLAAYRASAAEVALGHGVVPAGEWLLDNFHVVEAQVREVRDGLPTGFYRQLPKLADGPFAGYPRVLGLAWAYVAHTDSDVAPELLGRFIAAYQRVQPLTIGELWAVAITLRFVLIENLRRLAVEIADDRAAYAAADALADRIQESGSSRAWRDSDLEPHADDAWRGAFAAQLAKRLRDQDPDTTPALGWLEERLGRDGTSIEGVLAFTQQRLGAANVTMRNIVTSMRLMSDIDWAELFERVSLVDERLRARSSFAAMEFATRDAYRGAVEELARGSDATELEVAERVLATARDAAAADPAQALRVGDPGYFLIGDGRRAFERSLGARPSVRTRVRRAVVWLGLPGYVGGIGLATALLVALVVVSLAATGVGALWRVWIAVAMVLPMSEIATALANRLVTRLLGTTALPGLDLDTGVPSAWRTLVVVPTILSSEADLAEQVERLEVHHLGGADGDVTFALLADGVDADAEELPGDEALLAAAVAAFEGLNRRHPPGPAGPRFLLLHRRRVYAAGQGVWMGWERKRGKLRELNRLLRGATDTTFVPLGGRPPWVPKGVRFVLTLDADTRLPRGAAQKLVGKLAHPLNRPVLDATGRRVVRGYGVLQPRVTSPFPERGEDSVFRRVFGAPSGIDPYASAVSDVYQDLCGEGSFTGKGIYDVDAFEAALAGRIPDATMLSHDLFEGVFARAGLATDVEVVEASPSRYDVAVKRQHRWTRGDWQLLPWLFGRRSGPLAVPLLGRWKMLDNLRRSLLAPAALLALVSSWFLGPIGSAVGVAFVLGALVVPAFLPAFYAVVPRRSGVVFRNHLATLRADVGRSASQALLAVAFLPDTAWWMVDAIVRTLARVFRTRRHLLEWTTAAQQARGPRLGVAGFYRAMAGGTLVALGAAAAALVLAPASAWLVAPFAVLWAAAPTIASRISRPPSATHRRALTPADATELRLVARRTWRFFETFVTAEERHLPPDNFQEDPNPVVARRTSPTNVGLYLLSAVTARDFGWAGTAQTVARLEATLTSVAALEHFRGHLFNWYATEDGRVLEPGYVSSVDSGNLAGHLLVVANACEEWAHAPRAPDARRGMRDALLLAREALAHASLAHGALAPSTLGAAASEFAASLDALEARSRAPGASWSPLGPLVDAVVRRAADLSAPADDLEDLKYWVGALQRAWSGHDDDAQLDAAGTSALNERLRGVAATARSMALAMDFSFLVDPERGLLSIGYSLDENGLDRSCYDLLASEARLASLFAIAKGDVETRHWFRLGRGATPVGSGSVLLSWSGSMFEYLMPFLVMDAPAGSLLEQSQQHAVRRHRAYGSRLDVPWGVSESGYAARDHEFTYQYANFGVPELGLKRGLSESVVIAPYATGLATMVDPQRAHHNYGRLRELGALGRYGYYEALDYTPSRVPAGAPFTLVRSYMAHHQGMTVVAVANALDEGRMRARFHREPIIQAAELLLQERVPHDVVAVTPRADEVAASPTEVRAGAATVRRLHPVASDAPVTHLLSNGRYAVMLTATGAGYSRWHDLAVTRWRADATRDECGSFVFLRDAHSGDVWSAGIEPIGRGGADDVVEFAEDHAEFIRRNGTLTTTTDVLISGEEDAEVRRVSLTNAGRRERVIDVTSYAELVLTSAAVDAAHPAFAKLFVQTEYLPEVDALIATRRRRSPEEAEVWAAHLAVVEGETVGPTQYATDRARFLGRSRSIGEAAAIVDARVLSNSVGTVLDPIFALRRRVRVPPGEVARVAFWTVVAGSRSALMDAIDKHRDRSAFERAKTLAWTQAQVQMRFLDVTTEEAAEFQRLATPLLIADARFRAPGGAIGAGAGPQSGLWPHAISGDLPIVLLRIDDVADLNQVRQLLRAHEYWRLKRLAVDLVIVNEHAASYLQDLQVALETA